jgi:hypothetical protein
MIQYPSSPTGKIEKIVFWIREDKETLTTSDYTQILELNKKFSSNKCKPYFIICNQLTNNNVPFYGAAFADYFSNNLTLGFEGNQFIETPYDASLLDRINRDEYAVLRDTIITEFYNKLNIEVVTYSCGNIRTKYAYFKWIQDFIEPIVQEETLHLLIYSMSHFTEIEQAFQNIINFHEIPVQSNLQKFIGGNILFGDDYIICGADMLLDASNSCEVKQKPKDDVEKVIAKYLPERHQYFIGSESPLCRYNLQAQQVLSLQPFYHLDMFLTALGTYQNKELFLLADIQDDYIYAFPEDTDTSHRATIEYLQKLKSMLSECAASLAAQMKASGKQFEIIKIPIGFDFNSIDSRYLIQPVFSYNNCIVENTKDSITLYLPNFSFDSVATHPPQTYFDSLQAALFTSLQPYSFIKHVPIVLPFTLMAYEEKYGLHCISKVLARTTFKE